MKRGLKIKKILEYQGYTKLKRKFSLSLIILIIVLVIFSGYFLFFYFNPCDNKDCFDNAINHCKRVSWIREDDQAAWLYRILRNAEGDSCKVEVMLLKMKKGVIDSEKLQGKKMICIVQKGDTQFPEKDISQCKGDLKEELQDILIKRMHDYLLQNLGEIQEGFGEF